MSAYGTLPLIGSTYGRLTVLESARGTKAKAGEAVCRCECGNLRKVRVNKLKRKAVSCCAVCSFKLSWAKRTRPNARDIKLSDKISQYKQNAKAKNYSFNLTRTEFSEFLFGECSYCGETPSFGVDRIDNTVGYEKDNVVSCCSKCNYAKRDMPVSEFLEHISKIAKFRKFR